MPDTYTYYLIRDFERAAKKCFEFIGRRIEEGLKLPAVSIAHGGELAELRALPGFAELTDLAKRRTVTLYTSMQCISVAAYASPGSLSFGFCAPPHKFD